MRVIDFFCGAGGFSEGFSQAGFDVIWGVDKWQPAVLTHGRNHPTSNTILGDVEAISLLPDTDFDSLVPDSEVIIGSPPCNAFSNSNKSGKGNKDLGIRLIESYLRIIARKKYKRDSILKYWILENVPNACEFIKDEYLPQDLGLIGDFVLKAKSESSKIYCAQFFGVPSKRKRFLCGEFPEPKQVFTSENQLIPLSKVLQNFIQPESEKDQEIVGDPNYDFSLPSKEVSDFQYLQELADFEWKTARRLKLDKGYMGKMSFPEAMNKPARTVMATMTFSARESMIFGYIDGRFRAPTIREVASLMSFPIDYRFYGDSITIKYKLVGNAVPPKLSYALAKAILIEQKIPVLEKSQPRSFSKNDGFYDLNGKNIPINIEKQRRISAKFKNHIPSLKEKSYRVVLSNHRSAFSQNQFIWHVELHKGQGPYMKFFEPSLKNNFFSEKENELIDIFMNEISNKLLSFNELQKAYCITSEERKKRNLLGPYELLKEVKDFIDYCSKNSEDIISIILDHQTYAIPKRIVLGYFLLENILNKMEGKNG